LGTIFYLPNLDIIFSFLLLNKYIKEEMHIGPQLLIKITD
jgi:hypothetical protein